MNPQSIFETAIPPGQSRNMLAKLRECLRHEPVFLVLDSGEYYSASTDAGRPFYQSHTYDWIAGIGARRQWSMQAGTALDTLYTQWETAPCWLFGFLGYELNRETEHIACRHTNPLGFPDLFFFQPHIVVFCRDERIVIQSFSPACPARVFFENWAAGDVLPSAYPTHIPPLQNRTPQKKYMADVSAVIEHIRQGDVYELNYCQEFVSEGAKMDPWAAARQMSLSLQQPFSAFLRMHDRYALSASMERYLRKTGRELVSQPIKGTIRREPGETADKLSREQLQRDPKEKAENVMIVDLVRNDLSRVSVPGSVQVNELCGLYSFPTVHHLISTVQSELLPEKNWLDALKASFPMGSMTGAPKIMAMELIERYEASRRGLYSGALGYIDPQGDFDFNVVIRTLLYNKITAYLSVSVGSAITYDSAPEKEYEECLVKLEGWQRLLERL